MKISRRSFDMWGKAAYHSQIKPAMNRSRIPYGVDTRPPMSEQLLVGLQRPFRMLPTGSFSNCMSHLWKDVDNLPERQRCYSLCDIRMDDDNRGDGQPTSPVLGTPAPGNGNVKHCQQDEGAVRVCGRLGARG